MTYLDKYRSYLEEIPLRIEEMKKKKLYTAFGYTSDLDVLIKWDVDKFNHLLEEYLTEEPRFVEGESITNMADFARIVSYFAINGLGGELDITDINVYEYLKNSFDIRYALGGTGAQGAAALGALGVPLVLHITDRSRQVCEFLDYPEISMVCEGKLFPVMNFATDEPPVCHIILQFNKGDVLSINGKQYTIPLSNRLILDFDQIHKYLPIESDFMSYCEENASNIFSYNISGFNGIIDINILKERTTKLKEHYRKVKSNNPDCIIYLEGAHYLNPECKNYVFNELSDCIDILGMNEEEMVDLCAKWAHKVDKECLESVLAALEQNINRYPVKGIIMHTKDYSMYFGQELKKGNIEMGLTMGNLLSGTKARIGKYGSYEDCFDSLLLPLSPIGIRFANQLNEVNRKEYIRIVPSRYMDNPVDTIGLGDTFVAGVQLGFLE